MLLGLWLALVFVLGCVVGSGLNVCIYRLPYEKSLFWPNSTCGHCYQPIRWYDNIPLVSYWVLRGRCRTCKTKFSMRYFWVELFTGVVFAEKVLPFGERLSRALAIVLVALGIWVAAAPGTVPGLTDPADAPAMTEMDMEGR